LWVSAQIFTGCAFVSVSVSGDDYDHVYVCVYALQYFCTPA
jgi:hypothetical protein